MSEQKQVQEHAGGGDVGGDVSDAPVGAIVDMLGLVTGHAVGMPQAGLEAIPFRAWLTLRLVNRAHNRRFHERVVGPFLTYVGRRVADCMSTDMHCACLEYIWTSGGTMAFTGLILSYCIDGEPLPPRWGGVALRVVVDRALRPPAGVRIEGTRGVQWRGYPEAMHLWHLPLDVKRVIRPIAVHTVTMRRRGTLSLKLDLAVSFATEVYIWAFVPVRGIAFGKVRLVRNPSHGESAAVAT